MVTKDGKLICLDAKIGFDDNALFRHPDIEALRDFDRGGAGRGRGVAARAVLCEARRHHRLHGQRRRPRHGDHGHHQAQGGEPANFLDVGGGASKEKITEAFKIILSDPHVKGVLGQHLRRHHALRHHRRRHHRRGARGEDRRAARGAARRHQCRARQGAARRSPGSPSSPPTISTTRHGRSSPRSRKRPEGEASQRLFSQVGKTR